MAKHEIGLAEAIAQADLRVLLMVLFHLTGDHKWLSIRPRRDVRLVADPDAGLAPAVQDEIRRAALVLLTQPNLKPAIVDPGDSLMVEMMSACLGEQVAPEYSLLLREELGFVPRDVAWTKPAKAAAGGHHVVIVGAGVAGIALAVRLKTLGIAYTIIERNAEVGGVWLENCYPGCAVDTPSHSYSYSFGPRYPWSRYFSPRDEIQDYIERSATAQGLRPQIRFGTTVTAATWDEASCRWSIELATPRGEERIEATVLVSAIGQFGVPVAPSIEGAETFAGQVVHSGRWPQGLDLKDKRVAIIGTGASAMQIVPTVVDSVKAMTVYQRTPQWVRPIARFHDLIGEAGQWLLDHVPFYAQWFRFTMWWRYGDGLFPQLQKDPAWPHPERSINRSNDRHREEMTEYIRTELADRPELFEKCLPKYPPFGKRILLDNGWYRALKQPQLELVTDPIQRITPAGIVTADCVERPADILIYATGFHVAEMAARLNITGRAGRKLADVWADDNPAAFLGITVPEFPNFFVMLGPNSGLGHGGSTISQAENQARYISGCLVAMIERGIAAVEVKRDEFDSFIRKVDAAHERMIWTHPGMSTYYRNRRGRVVSVMPFRLVDYWQMTHDVDLRQYELYNRARAAAG